MAENIVAKWLETPTVKNETLPNATSTIATIDTKPTITTHNSSISINSESSMPLKTKNNQEEAAMEVSSILSGLYHQKSESEWTWLRLNKPEWWTKRIELENEVDAHFLNGDHEAAQEAFYQLVAHLKAAPIDELSSRIARQLDRADPKRPEIPTKAWKPRKLPGHPEAWDGTRISGREYYNLPPVKKVRP